VRKLIAGPGVFICDQCIDLCREVLEDDKRPAGTRKRKALSADPQRRESFELSAHELEFAILFAHGMGVEAISSCVGLNSRVVEVALMKAYKKMSASPNVRVASLHRRQVHDWLSERGLLPDRRESEAIVARAISAQRESETVLDRAMSAMENASSPWPRWMRRWVSSLSRQPSDRDRLEKRSAEEMAMLKKALRAIRKPFPREE